MPPMPTVIIASTNPVKIDAARQGFETMFIHTSESILSEGFAKSKGAGWLGAGYWLVPHPSTALR